MARYINVDKIRKEFSEMSDEIEYHRKKIDELDISSHIASRRMKG